MLNKKDFKNYDRLVKNIYQCTNPLTLRSTIMEQLPQLIAYDSAAFFQVDPITHRFASPQLYGLNEANFSQYTNYYEDRDIYKKAVFADRQIPCVDRSSDYLNYREWEKNEHRVDFLLPQGIYHIACLQILNGSELVGEISLHRAKNSPDFRNNEITILNLLHDHVNNAYSNATRLNYFSLLPISECNNLNDSIGICACNVHGKLLNANHRAQQILSRHLGNGQSVYKYLGEVWVDFAYRASHNNEYFRTGFINLRDGIIGFRVVVANNCQKDQPIYLTIFETTGIEKKSEDPPQTWYIQNKFKADPEPFLRIKLLGNLEVSILGEKVPTKLWRTRKTKSLFEYLVLQKGQPVSRERLMEIFWPEAGPAAASSLRVTLSRLRQALALAKEYFPGKTPFFGDEGGMVWFKPGQDYTLDVEEFEKLYKQGLSAMEEGSSIKAQHFFEQSLVIYKGDLLEEDLYEDWSITERERLQLIYLNILLILSNIYLEIGGKYRLDQAIGLLLKAMAANPYHEGTYLALMEAYIAADQKKKALQVFEKCRQMLAEEFGTTPGIQMRQLVDEIQKRF